MDPEPDPLLSVIEVARQIGHGVEATAELVAQGSIPSVDGGQLAERGRFNIGVVRKSRLLETEAAWANALADQPQVTKGTEDGIHPAVMSALAFLDAVRTGNDDQVVFLSTERTRERATSSRQLRRLWKRAFGSKLLKEAGLATGVYPYPDEPQTVILRLISKPAPVSYIVEKATQINSPKRLPLIEEEGVYRLDLPLFERQDKLNPHAGLAMPPLRVETSHARARAATDTARPTSGTH